MWERDIVGGEGSSKIDQSNEVVMWTALVVLPLLSFPKCLRRRKHLLAAAEASLLETLSQPGLTAEQKSLAVANYTSEVERLEEEILLDREKRQNLSGAETVVMAKARYGEGGGGSSFSKRP